VKLVLLGCFIQVNEFNYLMFYQYLRILEKIFITSIPECHDVVISGQLVFLLHFVV